jgi:hypothetical protein
MDPPASRQPHIELRQKSRLCSNFFGQFQLQVAQWSVHDVRAHSHPIPVPRCALVPAKHVHNLHYTMFNGAPPTALHLMRTTLFMGACHVSYDVFISHPVLTLLH